MLQLILLLAAGLLAGRAAGWLMSAVVREPRIDLATGALGALAAVSLARWSGVAGVDRVEVSLVLAVAGALALTFAAHIALQARRPGEWRAERAHAAHAAVPLSPSLASTASRAHPLLVLHDGHALRCWPTGGRGGKRMEGSLERLGWAVEVDGIVEHAGPSSWMSSTSREVAADVRRWWDATQAMAAARPSATAGRS